MPTKRPPIKETRKPEARIRPSINLRLIRHAESQNNQVYRTARHLYKGGTPAFDSAGWNTYVDKHRSADPTLSDTGKRQSSKLAEYLIPNLNHQASHPVRFVISPMRRTLETILPTLKGLGGDKCRAIVNAFYHESEGCHIKEVPKPGMSQNEITTLLSTALPPTSLSYDLFPSSPTLGWYSHGTGPETRAESEVRAAKFYVWLLEFLDQQLLVQDDVDDIYDAGVTVEGEEEEHESDKLSPKQRRRRSVVLVGHGDFTTLVLKRIIAGFGHSIELEGTPHRSAFVHYNTGITELEYFGSGRFLLMSSNHTPHLTTLKDVHLKTGGGLKDGWSYILPADEFVLEEEVSVAFEDEMEDSVREQTQALKSLYLMSGEGGGGAGERRLGRTCSLTVEENVIDGDDLKREQPSLVRRWDSGLGRNVYHRTEVCFVVKRGLEVVGCATYVEETGRIKDVVVRPSARGAQVGGALMDKIKEHVQRVGGCKRLFVEPSCLESQTFFEELGFEPEEMECGEEDEFVTMRQNVE